MEACQGQAGLSLGEYTALVFAGTMDFTSGLEVVRARGQAMQAASLATSSGMTSVLGLDEARADELCRRVASTGRLWKADMPGPAISWSRARPPRWRPSSRSPSSSGP